MRRTDRQRNYCHDQKVEVRDSAELLEKVLWQERQQGVFGRNYPILLQRWSVLLLFVRIQLVTVAANLHSNRFIGGTYTVSLE